MQRKFLPMSITSTCTTNGCVMTDAGMSTPSPAMISVKAATGPFMTHGIMIGASSRVERMSAALRNIGIA